VLRDLGVNDKIESIRVVDGGERLQAHG